MPKAVLNNKTAGFIIAETICNLLQSEYIHIMSIAVLPNLDKNQLEHI